MPEHEEWARLVHDKYDQCGFRLHRHGEWTVIAGILEVSNGPHVVALGAGLKCLPVCAIPSELRHQLVRDSHAEVLARRALIRYLLAGHQPGRLVMYISHSPCGDASMHVLEAPLVKRIKLTRGRDDAATRGLRTKPGRRDSPPTECVSCTDKIALWGTVGWQGALIDETVHIEEILIGEHFDSDALETGINDKSVNKYTFTKYTGLPFKHSRAAVLATGLDERLLVPSSVAQVWYEGGKPETLTDGRKLGSAKPRVTLPVKSQSCISTENIARARGVEAVVGKQKNTKYQFQKKMALQGPFQDWPVSDPVMKSFRDSQSPC
ncbi:Adenosine deaminase editase [Paramicrosporidium saccamoebae]|uniref:tRNA-specific adenosine deaminase 1 n=1 Tax=Paramicrosporidium saccamoebae TaxID=1246581 RepID=A0A2H9TLC9_9FUNG|nr:Adenosine deaminase editase [Paramicrosporidium saccamoebae]